MRYAGFVVLAFVATAAHASAWQWFGEASDGSKFAIDTSSVYKDGARVRFWMQWDYSHVTPRKAYMEKELNIVNCEQQTIGTMSYAMYSENGIVTDSGSTPDFATRLDPVIPDSVGERIMRKACALASGTDKGF